MDKWIRAGVIGTYLCLGAQLWGQFKTGAGGARVNYIPAILTVASALMVSCAALFSFGKWPFNNWTKSKRSVSEKARSLAFRIMLEKCQFLIKSYRHLSSTDPEHTKKPLSPDDSWPMLESNRAWTYTQLSLLRYSQDYSWLLNTAKKSFAEMGWEAARFFNENPFYLAEVLAALEEFKGLLAAKIASLEEQK